MRSSAVVAVAECVSALGPRCLPQLGPILDTVLQAAEASLAHIHADAAPAADPKQVCHLAPYDWLHVSLGTALIEQQQSSEIASTCCTGCRV